MNQLQKYNLLCNLAQIRVEEIKTDWSHEGFKAKNNEIYSKYCNENNIICTSVGENLAKGDFKNEADVVLSWENSPEHKQNMLGDYNVQCVAVSGTYYVSLFALTKDLDLIKKQMEDELKTNVIYNYQKVIFWEEQQKLNLDYIKNWNTNRCRCWERFNYRWNWNIHLS